MPFAVGNLPGRDLPPGLSSKLLATFGSGVLAGGQGAGGAGEDGEEEEEEAMSYEGLVGAFGAEERARAEMGTSVQRMRGEVEDLLSRRFQVGKHGRFAVPEGVSIEEPATPTEASQFVFRKCMCGCGEARLCRADAPDSGAEPVNIQWPTLEPARRSGATGDIVDAASQRAACERLTQRRRRTKAGGGSPTSEAGDYRDGSSSASTRPLAPLRQVDVERLNALAKPRELPPPPPPEPPQPPAPPSMEARRRRRAERSASEPSLVGSSSTPSLPPLGHGSTSFFSSRVVGATGAALRPPPRRAAKLKIGEGDPPGLSSLLQAAEDRFAAEALFGDFGGGGGGGGEESPPAWKTGKVRSSASQKGYLEARLYKKPSAKPGSLQELEQRLASLRAERHQRQDSSAAVAAA